MVAKLILAPEADQDIADAFARYEGQRVGLGEEFLCCVDACIEAISRNPEMYAFIHEDFRRALVRRFPYAIFCEISDGRVIVFGISHTSLDPRKWHGRIP